MTGLQIAPTLQLPLEAVTETFVILAKRGSGKTYTAAVLAEEIITAGHPCIVIDPIGVWWGLRSSADAKSPGLPVVIFGGDHGDVPLDEKSGELIADAIVAERFSAVLDLSLLSKTKSKTFMAAFIARLYHRNRDPLHIIVDEADAFAPQRTDAGGAVLLGAMEDLVRRGRARGMGCTLITQRPAVLNKDVLTQAEVLICLRMNGVRDVAAIDEWVRLHADEDEARELKKSLPSLPVGTAWIWSPGWLSLLERVQIRKRTTFDSSATPGVGQKRIVPKQMADIDIEALGEKIAATAEEAKASDPKTLQARIAQLERELAKPVEAKVETVEVPVLSEEHVSRIEAAYDKLTGAYTQWSDQLSGSVELANYVINTTTTLRRLLVDSNAAAKDDRRAARQQARPTAARATPAPKVTPPTRVTTDAGALPKAQQLILNVLIQNGPSTQIQVALLAGYSSKSGGFRNSLSALRTAGYIVGDKYRLEATDDGIHAAGDVPPLPTGEALLDHWRGLLSKAERAVFDALVEAYPAALSADELGELTDYSATSGGFRNALSKLRTLQLATGGKDAMVLADTLGGAA